MINTISSRAYVNAVETAYAGYLKAKGLLDESTSGVEDAASGATSSNDAMSGATATEEGDTMSGATNTACNDENNVTEEEK